MANGSGTLAAPERNNYFYGKLMDAAQFEKEQRYCNDKRWLLNRLVLGSGVLAGLNVTEDPAVPGAILVGPGVALDGIGHEIVVPEEVSVDPHQLTDEHGNPMGDPIADGSVEMRLVYAEAKVDPVPVLVASCDTPGNCAPSTIREGFRILVYPADPPVESPDPKAEGSPMAGGQDLQDYLKGHIAGAGTQTPTDPGVALAQVNLEDGSIQQAGSRDLVYGNALLYTLIVDLAEQVEQLAHCPLLRYVSGDGQIGKAGKELPSPLQVQLVDRAGNPIGGAPVVFEVVGGDGKVDRKNVRTRQDGIAWTRWELGQEGEQIVEAGAAGTLLKVTFKAIVSRGA